jgi:hypothetical protein
VNHKGNQHTKTCLVFLLITFSFYSSGSLRNADALEIGFPDIPFLNFFDSSFESGSGEESPEENTKGKVSDIISTNDSREAKDDDLSSNVDTSVDEYEPDVESSLQTFDTLPFPSNSLNNVPYGHSDKVEEDKEVLEDDGLIGQDYDQITSFTPNTSPVISDYSDFPSIFLEASPATNEFSNEMFN